MLLTFLLSKTDGTFTLFLFLSQIMDGLTCSKSRSWWASSPELEEEWEASRVLKSWGVMFIVIPLVLCTAQGCQGEGRMKGNKRGVCCCSVAKLCLTLATPWTTARQAPLSLTVSQRLLRFLAFESMMLSNHLELCLPPSPFTFSLSEHQSFPMSRLFAFKWLKCWSFSISPSSE